MNAKPFLSRLAASGRLAGYVWLIALIGTLPVYLLLGAGRTYTELSFGSVALFFMIAWAALLSLPVFSWLVFLIILSFSGLSKSLWQHALVSSLAGGAGSVLLFLAYLLLRSGDGISDGYLALGLFVPLVCVLVFPILALIFTRFHKPLRLSALFAAAPREAEMANISQRQEVNL